MSTDKAGAGLVTASEGQVFTAGQTLSQLLQVFAGIYRYLPHGKKCDTFSRYLQVFQAFSTGHVVSHFLKKCKELRI